LLPAEAASAVLRCDLDRIDVERLLAHVVVALGEPQVADALVRLRVFDRVELVARWDGVVGKSRDQSFSVFRRAAVGVNPACAARSRS
jgi:hypothetical protein